MAISCEKFLEEEPPTFISGSNYFKTADDARSAVDGVYKSLLTAHERWWAVVDAYTDDQVGKSNEKNYNAFGQHTVLPSDAIFENQDYGIYKHWWV